MQRLRRRCGRRHNDMPDAKSGDAAPAVSGVAWDMLVTKCDETWWNQSDPCTMYMHFISHYMYTYIYIHYTCVWVTVTMVEGHFSIAGVFKHCKAIGPHPKAIIWDHTRQSIKLGVNQANTVVHIHRTGKTDEGNLTCGALFPAVTISFGIQLARSLSLSLSHSLPLSVVFVANFLQTMSYVGGVI